MTRTGPSRRLLMCCVAALVTTGCPRTAPPPPDAARDAGLDAARQDGGQDPIDAALDVPEEQDAGPPDGNHPDAGPPLTGSMPAPPAEVLRIGSGGFLLRGTVLAPEGPIAPGEVLIVGDTIRCVAADCSGDPASSSVTRIDTHATIAPGLIDAHNHLTYNFLPEWVPDPLRLFMNRYQWADDPTYEAHIQPETAGGTRGDFVCPATKWGELRSIVHGTTTVMGQSPNQSCVDRLARNADHYHGLGPDRMQTTISSVRDVTDTQRMTLVANFLVGNTTRYVVHMGEGVSGSFVDREFESFAGRDSRTVSLLYSSDGTPFRTGVFIHGIALDEAEIMEANVAGVRFVWSPSSNILLYGRTAPIDRMLAVGAVVGLGPDWTVSGSDEMLSEMRFALEWARAEGMRAITPERLVRMATEAGAEVLGLEAAVGRLAPGLRADVAVFGRVAADPYLAVIESRAADVRLVMIDGAAYYGDLALEAATAVNGDCEMLDACGAPKFLCAANTPGSTTRATERVEDVRNALLAHLTTYGRAADLLELVDCAL